MCCVLLIEILCSSKIKTASLVKYKRRRLIYIFKSKLKAADPLAEHPLQAYKCMVIPGVVATEVELSKCKHVPQVIFRSVAIFTMHHQVVQRYLRSIII